MVCQVRRMHPQPLGHLRGGQRLAREELQHAVADRVKVRAHFRWAFQNQRLLRFGA